MSDLPTDPAAPASAASPSPSASQYEFSPLQEGVIDDLASKMRFVGMFLLVFGSLGLASMVVAWIKGFWYFDASSLLVLFFGYWTLGASKSFGMVVTTRGRDINHLMKALLDLRSLYALAFFLLLALLVLAIVSLVMVAFAR